MEKDRPNDMTPEMLEKLHRGGQEVLDAFVQICEENHLRYYLYYGTLLGAVRHKGPIPWDDDIDVAMPREDYEKFRALMLARPEGEKYYISCYETEPRPYVPFFRFNQRNSALKVMLDKKYRDLWVDIFPLDDMPDAPGTARDMRILYVKFLKKLVFNRSFTYGEIKDLRGKILHTLLLPVSYDWLYRVTERQVRRQGKAPGAYYESWSTVYTFDKEALPKEWYEPSVEVEYGGKRYRAPKDWDKVLTQIYGDYMIPPPHGGPPRTRQCDRDSIAAKPIGDSPELSQELMEKIHQIGQEILDAFVRICEENGLRYYLFYGTLLGAVRHKGPIPWDDDVDVVMPREDMEAFRKLMLSRPADELYHVHCRENDPYIPLQYLRFCKKDTVYLTEAVASFNTQCRELWMDIWPLDYAPMNTGWEHDLHVGLVKLFKRASYNKALIVPRKSLCGRIFHIFLRPVSFEWLKDCTRRLMVEWNKREAKYYVCWNYNYSITKETFPIEWFGAGEKESYGGKLYCVPACWDKVLTQIYGDYMTLPPEEERRNHGPLEIKL